MGSELKPQKIGESFFARCQRDDEGHCTAESDPDSKTDTHDAHKTSSKKKKRKPPNIEIDGGNSKSEDAESGNGSHEYGCLMAVLPVDAAKAIINWGQRNVNDEDLATGGREEKPHITIKYGFQQTTEEAVPDLESLLLRYGPIQVRIVGLSFFDGWNNEDGTPLIIKIESDQLIELNKIISESFETVDKHPDYHPHITIAYLKPDLEERYLKKEFPFSGEVIDISEVEWSGADGTKKTISLSHQKSLFGRTPMPNKAMSAYNELSGGALVGAKYRKRNKNLQLVAKKGVRNQNIVNGKPKK